ncbi:protein translocase subunit SecF [Desulfitibacter alkalitolerans]|uniref:protein translocase subunit SecF n=1 Tax=Desulfitibacter alkalitolerans TaxID=264641 RepID=UPI000485FE3D|nr:protein translocase subunit SecF [Desulfitibacter alkalitolerans]
MFFDFIGKRKLWFLMSLIIIIPGLISLMFQGLNLGIDFAGGTKVMVKFSQEVSSEDIREVLSEHNLGRSTIQASENNQFIIRTPILTEQENTQVVNALREKLGDMQILSNESVGSVVSAELQEKAIIALLIATVLMVVYITIRFELSFALSAITALFHDILITLSIFSIFQIEINISFVAAILTIIGYSINDTIVIFDRIRENLEFRQKETLSELVNKSIHQNLVRSIFTSLTSVAVLLALLIFGGDTTRVFALAMIIGFISGTYSSICIASPVWLELKKRWFVNDRRKKKKVNPAPSR